MSLPVWTTIVTLPILAMRPARASGQEQMEDDIELNVRSASASLDGDTARIAVFTDHGRVTLLMHRFVLGALGGTIARALWPRTEERVAPFGDAEPQDAPTQRDSQEPGGEPVSAVAGVELQDIPTQPEPQEVEGETVAAKPHSIPTQPELEEPEGVALAAFDALWPKDVEPVAPSAGVEGQNIPTQPESQEPEGEPCRCIRRRRAAKRCDPTRATRGAEPQIVPGQPGAQEAVVSPALTGRRPYSFVPALPRTVEFHRANVMKKLGVKTSPNSYVGFSTKHRCGVFDRLMAMVERMQPQRSSLRPS